MAVAIYLRVSSDDQAKRETIKSQEEYAKKYIDLHEIKDVEWYKDDGVSGALPLASRPAGAKLLEDAQNGKIEYVLFYAMSRFGRSSRIILNAIYDLEQLGVQIKSMTEPLDTATPSGRLIITMMAGFAEHDRMTILERLSLGADRAAKEGKWLGGIVPYGYRVIDKFLVINENPMDCPSKMSEADVIRMIYKMLAVDKVSSVIVSKALNAMNIPTAYISDKERGKRRQNTQGIWTPARIINMTMNPIYKGIHFYGRRTTRERELIERKMPAIVSEEDWAAARETLEKNRFVLKRKPHFYMLSGGLLKCGMCGRNYVGKMESQGKRYYRCSSNGLYNRSINGPRCPGKMIRIEELDSTIWEKCKKFISELKTTPTSIIKKEKTLMESRKIINYDILIGAKENEKQSVLDLYRKQLISFEDLELQLKKIQEERVILEQRQKEDAKKEIEQNNYWETPEGHKKILSIRKRASEDLTAIEKTKIIKLLINKITIITVNPEVAGKIKKIKLSIDYNFKP